MKSSTGNNPEAGLEIYCVGGAVRDRLLNEAVKDRDWVVIGSNDEEMRGRGFRAVGKSFPVYLHPHSKEEYALARRETKIAAGYQGFTFDTGKDVSLTEDLARRDLTINAIAEDRQGRLIDPFEGRRDLEKKILRHVSPAFQEDPVRILRLGRFLARYAKYEFKVHPDTLELLCTMVDKGEVAALVAERVWQELSGALSEPSPAEFVRLLRQCGALAIVFPELNALYGVQQRADFHPEGDAATHTLMVLSQAAMLDTDPIVRFAALVHDLGKALTPIAERPGHLNHEHRGVKVIRKFCQRLRVPRKFESVATLCCKHHLNIHRGQQLRSSTIVSKLTAMGAWKEPLVFRQILTVCQADALGRGDGKEKPYQQRAFWEDCLELAAPVSLEEHEFGHLQGKAIGDALQKKRADTIERWRAEKPLERFVRGS